MKTVFVLYMLTLIQGQSPQVTKLDTFDTIGQCFATESELDDFYNPDRAVKNHSGIVIFKCIEKKISSDGCKSVESGK